MISAHPLYDHFHQHLSESAMQMYGEIGNLKLGHSRVGAFSVIVKTDGSFAALSRSPHKPPIVPAALTTEHVSHRVCGSQCSHHCSGLEETALLHHI